MIDRIRGFLDSAFESAPQTAKVQELKEELFANLVDKYNDQLRQGRAPGGGVSNRNRRHRRSG